MTMLLFDDDIDDPDAPIVPEEMKFANCLIVGPVAPTSEALNEIELLYRREGRPPVLFADLDAETDLFVLGNAGQMAAAMNVSPIGLTLEAAQAWLIQQYARKS